MNAENAIVENVVAVVVAFNRRELLRETLTALLAQTSPVGAIVVVDNASADGSGELARSVAPSADVIVLDRNTGGAGGFTVGMVRALGAHDADLVWVMDDDTVPTVTALEELLRVRRAVPDKTSVLASRVVWTDGRDHPMNTPRRKLAAPRALAHKAAELDAYVVRTASFVSLMIPAPLIRARGLPVADYFLWNDDFEYSARLIRGGAGILCRRSVVEHRTKVFSGIQSDPGERFYFEVRNKLWMLRRSHGVSRVEKLYYLLASLVRWVDVFRRSRNRGVLLRGLGRGLRDGLRTDPRPNSVVLAGLGDTSEAILAFEGTHRVS